MKSDVGMAIAAAMGELNKSMLVEIAAAKVQMQVKAAGGDFGKVVEMGKKQLA